MSMTTRAAQIVATGADTFNVTVNAGLPTGANVIGLVNSNADAAIAAGTAPAKCEIVGAVYNSSAPAPTTGQTVALQLDSAGRLTVNNSIGSTTWISQTPTLLANQTYTTGQEIGGKLTFAISGTPGSGVLQSIRVSSNTKQTTQLSLFLFDTNPTNTTWTDHATPAINTLDVPFLMGAFNLGVPSNGLGTHAIWNLSGIGFSFIGANLYGVLVNTSASTTVSFFTGGVFVKIGVIDD